MLNINQQGCTTARMTLPTSHIFRVTEEVSGGRQSSFSTKTLCYESSTPTSQELSSPFFESLPVCLSVSDKDHLTKPSLSSLYKGIKAIY